LTTHILYDIVYSVKTYLDNLRVRKRKRRRKIMKITKLFVLALLFLAVGTGAGCDKGPMGPDPGPSPTPATFVFKSPVGGETWELGSTQTITWEGYLGEGLTPLDFMLDSYDGRIMVMGSVPPVQKGSFVWRVGTDANGQVIDSSRLRRTCWITVSNGRKFTNSGLFALVWPQQQ
jgi:hypothetical protein